MLSNPRKLQLQEENISAIRQLERDAEVISDPRLVGILNISGPERVIEALDDLELAIRHGEVDIDSRELTLFIGRALIKHHGGKWGVSEGPERDGERFLLSGVYSADGRSFDSVSVWSDLVINDRPGPPLSVLMHLK